MRSREEIIARLEQDFSRIEEYLFEMRKDFEQLKGKEQEKPGEWKTVSSNGHVVEVYDHTRNILHGPDDPFSKALAEFVAMLLNNGQRFSKRHWVQNMTYTDEADTLFDALRKLNGRGEENDAY